MPRLSVANWRQTNQPSVSLWYNTQNKLSCLIGMGALNGRSNFGFLWALCSHTLQLNSFNMNPNSLIVIIASYSTLTFSLLHSSLFLLYSQTLLLKAFLMDVTGFYNESIFLFHFPFWAEQPFILPAKAHFLSLLSNLSFCLSLTSFQFTFFFSLSSPSPRPQLRVVLKWTAAHASLYSSMGTSASS